MKLQLVTIFRSPTPYLLIFIVMPVLYILSSSFLPAQIVLPAILIIEIFTITFFVFGTALFQAKNSIVFKRLDVVGLTRAKFVAGNAILSVIVSLFSIYVFLEIFGTIVGLMNIDLWFLTPQEIWNQGVQYSSNLMIPMTFNWFIFNDLCTALDDAIWIGITDILNFAADLTLIDPDKMTPILESLAVFVDDNPFIWKQAARVINSILENIGLSHIVTEDNQLAAQWIRELEIRIEEDNGIVSSAIRNIATKMTDSFNDNAGHAPVGLLSDIIFTTIEENPSLGEPIIWDSVNNTILYRANKTYAFYFFNSDDIYDQDTRFYTQILYSRFAPTISTLFSPQFKLTTTVAKSIKLEPILMITTWLMYFATFSVVSLLTYSIMLMFISISNNFEQYSLLSGLLLVVVVIFSGLIMPITFILSLPIMFTFASLIPTTPLIFYSQYLYSSHGETVHILAQTTLNMYWIFAYPIAISIFSIIISMRMLSSENGKLTKKFNHDERSKRISIVNLVTNILFILIIMIWYYSMVKYRVEHSQEIGMPSYPNDLKMFLAQSLFIGYSLLLFVNSVFLGGRSLTFYRLNKLVYLLNGLLLLPIGIFTFAFGWSATLNTDFNNKSAQIQ